MDVLNMSREDLIEELKLVCLKNGIKIFFDNEIEDIFYNKKMNVVFIGFNAGLLNLRCFINLYQESVKNQSKAK